MAELERFVAAQDEDAGVALAELRAGRKQSHWIWYVFPQLSGLGRSRMSQVYGIRDREEAVAYLRHPLLLPRLLTATSTVAEQLGRGIRLDVLMGAPIDSMKLVSSLTLFAAVARSLLADGDEPKYTAFVNVAEEVLAAGESEGYPRCRYTLDRLGAQSDSHDTPRPR